MLRWWQQHTTRRSDNYRQLLLLFVGAIQLYIIVILSTTSIQTIKAWTPAIISIQHRRTAPYNTKRTTTALLLSKTSEEEKTPATLFENRSKVYYVNIQDDGSNDDIQIQHFQTIGKDHDDNIMISNSDIVSTTIETAAKQCWNWCSHFVARYGLCPWAPASVQTNDAIRIYCMPINNNNNTEKNLDVKIELVLNKIANDFITDMKEHVIDPNTAISFLVLINIGDSNSNWVNDFDLFYDWFIDLEEYRWRKVDDDDDDDIVTLAPFHPNWSYINSNDATNDDDDETTFINLIDLEKQSPYPIITVVATSVIEKAGETATDKIAKHNEKILNSKCIKEWKDIYNTVIYKD